MRINNINNSYVMAAIFGSVVMGVIASTACSFKPGDETNRLQPPPHKATATKKPSASSRATSPVAQRRVESVTTRTFDEKVMKSSSPVLVDFYADWCGPCRTQGKILKDFVIQLEGVSIVKVDVDENAELARRFEVSALPTLLVIQDGEVTERQVGLATEAQLKSVFAKYLVGAEKRAKLPPALGRNRDPESRKPMAN